MEAVYRVLQYLKGNPGRELTLKKQKTEVLIFTSMLTGLGQQIMMGGQQVAIVPMSWELFFKRQNTRIL